MHRKVVTVILMLLQEIKKTNIKYDAFINQLINFINQIKIFQL